MATCNRLIDLMHQIVDMFPAIENADDLWIVVDNMVRVINVYIVQCVVFLDNV